MRDLAEMPGPRPLTSSLLGSPYLRFACETTRGPQGGCWGKVTNLVLEGLPLLICRVAVWPRVHTLSSLPSVLLRIFHGLPLLRHFVFSLPNFGEFIFYCYTASGGACSCA